jgi:hypothetical protein
LDDPKVATLSDRLWRRFIECLLLAGDYEKEGELPSMFDMAWRLRLTEEMLETDLVDLSKCKLIEHVEGVWKVSKFKERQRARTSSERAELHRKRQSIEEYESGWFDNAND